MTKLTFAHFNNIFFFPILFDRSIIFCQVKKIIFPFSGKLINFFSYVTFEVKMRYLWNVSAKQMHDVYSLSTQKNICSYFKKFIGPLSCLKYYSYISNSAELCHAIFHHSRVAVGNVKAPRNRGKENTRHPDENSNAPADRSFLGRVCARARCKCAERIKSLSTL